MAELKDFKKKDLVKTELETILSKLEDLVEDGKYAEVSAFIDRLQEIGQSLEVTENGEKVVSNKNAQADYVTIVTEVKKKFEELTSKRAVVGTEATQISKIGEKIGAVDKAISVILREDELLHTMLEKGISNDQVIANAEKEIAASNERTQKITELRDAEKEKLDAFGHTITSPDGKTVRALSKQDKVKAFEKANTELQKITRKLEEIRRYQEGLSDPKITGEQRNATTQKISDLTNEISAIKDGIKALGTGMDMTTPEIKAGSLAEIDASLDSLGFKYKIGDPPVEHDPTGNPNTYAKKVQDGKNNTIEEIRNIIKADFAKYGFASEAEVVTLKPEQLQATYDSIVATIKGYEGDLAQEEAYRTSVEASKDKFKALADREKELRETRLQADKQIIPEGLTLVRDNPDDGTFVFKNDDGDEVILTAVERDGKIIGWKDEEGHDVTSVEIEGYDYTDSARQDAISSELGKTESEYIDAEVEKFQKDMTAARATAGALSNSEKRSFIRRMYQKEGEIHPIKWLRSQLFPNSMWKQYEGQFLSEQVGGRTEDSTRQVAQDKIAEVVEQSLQKDVTELGEVQGQTKTVRDQAMASLKRAIAQQRMMDGIADGRTDVEEKATRAAAMTGLKEGIGEIKIDDTQIQNRAFTQDPTDLRGTGKTGPVKLDEKDDGR